MVCPLCLWTFANVWHAVGWDVGLCVARVCLCVSVFMCACVCRGLAWDAIRLNLVYPQTVGMVGPACAPVAEGPAPLLHLLVSGRILAL